MFLLKVQSMMKVDVIEMGRNDEEKTKPLNARTMGSLIFMAKSDNPVALEIIY